MLREPALLARHDRGDAQREAFLPEQRVAAVAAAEGPDLLGLGIMHDVLMLLVAGPGDVLLPRRKRGSNRVHARNEVAVGPHHLEHLAANTRHELHVRHHVGRIGEFHTDVGDMRPQRPHAVGDHVHRASAHAAFEELPQLCPHLVRRHPVIVGTGVLLVAAADKGALFHACDIIGIGPRHEAARALLWIELDQHPARDHLSAQPVVLFLRAVAPVDPLGLGESRDLLDPCLEPGVLDVGGC